MCTTYFSTYTNCYHRPFHRTRCTLYLQDRRTCAGKVEVRTDGGLVCPACFDKIVWVRANGEWETIETPEGDLGKDDWEQVERVGYDWQENNKTNDAKVGVDGNRPAPPAAITTKRTHPTSQKTTERQGG